MANCFACGSSLCPVFCWVHGQARVCPATNLTFMDPSEHMTSPLCGRCNVSPALILCLTDKTCFCHTCFMAARCASRKHMATTVPFTSHVSCNPAPNTAPAQAKKNISGVAPIQQIVSGKGKGKVQGQSSGAPNTAPAKQGLFSESTVADILGNLPQLSYKPDQSGLWPRPAFFPPESLLHDSRPPHLIASSSHHQQPQADAGAAAAGLPDDSSDDSDDDLALSLSQPREKRQKRD